MQIREKIIEDAVEININPVEGLKPQVDRVSCGVSLVEININPVEGLKQIKNLPTQ